MDLNELFSRHQLALIAVTQNKSPAARSAAAREADDCAAKIGALPPVDKQNRAVLSSRTLIALAANPLGSSAAAKRGDK